MIILYSRQRLTVDYCFSLQDKVLSMSNRIENDTFYQVMAMRGHTTLDNEAGVYASFLECSVAVFVVIVFLFIICLWCYACEPCTQEVRNDYK
jgi:hypothetical protein